MSGHSKWANIRVRKTAQDKVRGKIYTRHAKLIEIAAQKGGDPVTNSSLRVAIDNAKAENVPNASIDRAIKKGTGELKGEQMAEIVYAAYLPAVALPVRQAGLAGAGGPGSIACLIECLTDNKNRTLSNVRMIINKNGGNFAESSSVLWMFERKGVVTARTSDSGQRTSEELELQLIDQGAEDIDVTGDTMSVTTDPTNWTKVRDFLKQNGFEVVESGQKYLPKQKAEISDVATAQKLMNFVSAIEEDEDVSEVHTNAEIGEEVASSMQ